MATSFGFGKALAVVFIVDFVGYAVLVTGNDCNAGRLVAHL